MPALIIIGAVLPHGTSPEGGGRSVGQPCRANAGQGIGVPVVRNLDGVTVNRPPQAFDTCRVTCYHDSSEMGRPRAFVTIVVKWRFSPRPRPISPLPRLLSSHDPLTRADGAYPEEGYGKHTSPRPSLWRHGFAQPHVLPTCSLQPTGCGERHTNVNPLRVLPFPPFPPTAPNLWAG